MTKFDPFGKGLYRYTFENICKEDNSLCLNDGAKKVFFNTKGTKGKISEQAKAILDYIDKSATNDEFTKNLNNEVEKARKNEKWRREYMKTLLHDDEIRQEGRQEGLRVGRQEGLQEGRQEGLQVGQAKQIIKISMEYHVETEKILSKLITELNISENQAREYLKQYGK